MSRRNCIGISIVIILLFFDGVVYKYQGANNPDIIFIRCYPTGEILSLKDPTENNKDDAVYDTILNRKNSLTSKSGFMNYKIGTKEKPFVLKTPSLSSEYTMHVDEKDGKEVLVCTVGKTVLLYDTRCLADLHSMLVKHGDWMELGSADEQKPAREGTIEAWGRSEKNPVKGWYGLKKGLRGRFGMYIPPLLEKLGIAEVTHEAKGNKMRAI